MATETVVLPAADAIQQISASMRTVQPQPLVTVPVHTTVQAALSHIAGEIGTVDTSAIFFPRRTEKQRKLHKESALQNIRDWNAINPLLSRPSFGQPIRSSIDMNTVGLPKPSSPSTRNKLKENIKNLGFRQPYQITIRAGMMEKTLPTIKGNIILRHIDYEDEGGIVLKDQEILWDTGAQQTFISEELLAPADRESLRRPHHDIYRTSNGLRLQMDANIRLSNASLVIVGIVNVIPARQLPNEFVGVILGQAFCIDRLAYRSIPKRILAARGEDVAEDVWGDIIIDEYIDEDENLIKF